MAMLKKDNTPKRKNLLTHNPPIEVENQVDRDRFLKATLKPVKTPAARSTTSVRVTTATRDLLNALVTIGEGDSVDDIIASLVNEKVETLRPDQQRALTVILDMASSKRKG